MNRFLYLVLLLCCIGLFSCEKAEDKSIKLTETLSKHTIVLPDTSDAKLTFTDVYPSYFQPINDAGEAGIGYSFYFKEGGTITSDKNFGVRHIRITDNYFEDIENLLFEAEEAFTPEIGESYRIYIYLNGSILAEYEGHPMAVLEISVISAEDYEIMLEDENKYRNTYPISNLTG